jgi:hypothetical protein
VALQAVLLTVADWRMAWTVAGLSSSPLRFFFLLCSPLFLFSSSVSHGAVAECSVMALKAALLVVADRRMAWTVVGFSSSSSLCFFFPSLFSSVSVFFFCFSRCCCRVCCGGGCWSVELLWEATVALLLSVQRREPVFFFSSLPPSLSRFFLSLTFPLYCFSFPSGPLLGSVSPLAFIARGRTW